MAVVENAGAKFEIVRERRQRAVPDGQVERGSMMMLLHGKAAERAQG